MPKQNIGHDLDISISLGGQVVKDFGLHTSTHFQPKWTTSTVTPTNFGGRTSVRSIFNGHSVTLTFARVNNVGDAIAQFLEDTYKAGGADTLVTMLRTTRNADGSVDQYKYTGGTIWPMDDGDFKGNDDVPETFEFHFEERNLVSSTSPASTFGGQALTSS